MVGREWWELENEANSDEYLAKVQNSENLDETRLVLIQTRIENDFYKKMDIIEKIADELLGLQNFIEDFRK